MARHRNIRSMNYTDEYDGYDDVYGHSVEEDYCMSPTDAAFMYDRESSKNQHMGEFFKDIAEEDEPEQISDLSKVDKARLESCINQMKITLGPSFSHQEMAKSLINNNFNVEHSINFLLDNDKTLHKPTEKKDVNLSTKLLKFTIPKLSKFDTKLINKFSNLSVGSSKDCNTLNFDSKESTSFTSLADLTNSHLKKVNFQVPSVFEKQKPNVILSKKLNVLPINTKSQYDIDGSWHVDLSKAIEDRDKAECDNEIDLTKAIKATRSVPAVNKKAFVEDNYFEIPFVECDIVYDDPRVDDYCTLDVSFILNDKHTHLKKVSSFGSVICRKYKRYSPYVIINNNRACKRFSFTTPSPDDKISEHLRRK